MNIASKIVAQWERGRQLMNESDGTNDRLYHDAIMTGVGDVNVASALQQPEGRAIVAQLHDDDSITLFTDDGWEAERMWVATGKEYHAAMQLV